MGLLDDAIREHLELKRRHGAAEDEVSAQEAEVLGGTPAAPEPEPEPAVQPPAPEPEAEAAPSPEPTPEPEPEAKVPEPEPWLDEPDEVPFQDALDHRRQPTTEFTADEVAAAQGEPAPEYVAPDEEPAEDLLEETPDFLQETPEHDRLWFEQKPPRDFDFGS